MDENTWRIVQMGMWIIGIQTTVILAVMGALHASLTKKIDAIIARLDRVDNKVNELDKRIIAIETMMHMKDCCILKASDQIKKAE